ncbi:MAG: VOC family protein, partial [Caldilineaceae bacterium]|nr:VOC family protein [Caldilineaceae bacterium]
MKTLKADLKRDGVPFTAFQVDDVYGEYERMQALGVEFTMEPTNMGTTSIAILDDTCGNLIQIYQMMG